MPATAISSALAAHASARAELDARPRLQSAEAPPVLLADSTAELALPMPVPHWAFAMNFKQIVGMASGERNAHLAVIMQCAGVAVHSQVCGA